MSSLLANNFLELLLKMEIDFDVDTFKVILMQSGYVFNRATHEGYADVSSSELATAYGYTAAGETLSGATVSQDDTNNAGVVTWGNVSWNVSGGDLTASGAIIYDDTHSGKAIVGYIDFGGDQTTLNGGVATIANPKVQLKG